MRLGTSQQSKRKRKSSSSNDDPAIRGVAGSYNFVFVPMTHLLTASLPYRESRPLEDVLPTAHPHARCKVFALSTFGVSTAMPFNDQRPVGGGRRQVH